MASTADFLEPDRFFFFFFFFRAVAVAVLIASRDGGGITTEIARAAGFFIEGCVVADMVLFRREATCVHPSWSGFNFLGIDLGIDLEIGLGIDLGIALVVAFGVDLGVDLGIDLVRKSSNILGTFWGLGVDAMWHVWSQLNELAALFGMSNGFIGFVGEVAGPCFLGKGG